MPHLARNTFSGISLSRSTTVSLHSPEGEWQTRAKNEARFGIVLFITPEDQPTIRLKPEGGPQWV
jgi:hypothetical protein